ncbi:peroxiredoxin [filamentous cyanobacterium LEGE 11480]|uniref:thioredoxin-dependent peroxiredoxin n=1 Tax=Romeriopsis navalis LEGE 11480 TaxID=2777977 RepID=A0A928VNC9_9CYAN|nr:peroxiredoxin [Romeriopsis navalis]MBE9030792.1 peroxiredoxin [Romeriopsis navalis LEGE 11480]
MLRCLIPTVLAFCAAFLLFFTQPVLALGGTLPTLDQPAPAFTLPTNTGEGDISLTDYKGQWVVAYFYPADFTPGCTLEARRFQEDLPKYMDRNTQVLGISADDIQSHSEFCDSEGLKFPLLADTDGSVSKAYGSWLGIRSVRHTFVIDPEGVIRSEFTGVNPALHSKEVLETLDRLQNA